MRFVHWMLAGAVLSAAVALPAEAGNSRRKGTAGAQELRIPASARALALGEGFIAEVNGAEAMWYNPAGVCDLAGTEVYLSHLNYLADIDKNFVSAVTKTGYGSLGFMVDVLSFGDIEETTTERPEGTGRIYSPSFTTLGITYSRYLTDNIAMGVAGKVLNEKILQTTATGVAFDFGLNYRLSYRDMRVAMILKNFGPDMQFDGSDFESFHQTGDDPTSNPRSLASRSSSFDLPAVFQIGLSYNVYDNAQNRVMGFGNFVSNNYSEDEYQFGAEYTYGRTLALRGGLVATQDDEYNFGPSYGVGVGVPLGGSSFLNFDYGRRTVDDFFDDNDMFSVKFTF